MNHFLSFIMVFMVFGVLVLGWVTLPYYGVVSLMGVSFFCCIFLVAIGRTFAALVMYIVYLGGLVVVFGYCVSVEKGGKVLEVVGFKYFVVFVLIGVVVLMCGSYVGWVGGVLVYFGLEDVVSLEVNGSAVFYCVGGAGLMVCSWGLLLVLFSVLVILGWSRIGGVRPF
uniref:NADH dehydrogenase subunit 6 n=1 Tax=Myanophis thanlyinensis TaxID=2777982 RepID=A0A8B0R823_9SAUR|nr:NADH dehydrogenase subunit 6 [Myanophis thanlyinensis]QTW91652.1 NADH dehydrogenase subunit 6 [Myanophis thanlyinensis]